MKKIRRSCTFPESSACILFAKMVAIGLFFLAAVTNCVSLPVTQSLFGNEDMKVMKCIVEALADVLSRPHPLPVSQECVDTLRTDERLVSILRHRNFLKELQNIAVQGFNERTQQSDHSTQTPQTLNTDDVADQSMLEALSGPGERSIISKKKGAGVEAREVHCTEKDGGTQEGNEILMKRCWRPFHNKTMEEREDDQNPDNHISDSMNEEENKADRGASEEEGEEKRETSEEDSEETRSGRDSVTQEEKDSESNEKRDAPERLENKKSAEKEEKEEEDNLEKKRSALLLSDSAEKETQEEEEEGEVKRESSKNKNNDLARSSQLRGRAGRAEGPEPRSLEVTEEVPHHSQEAVEGEKDGEVQRSWEVKELQMMARRAPDMTGEEEGSASRKSEDPEIESLAAIESELENVAEKLHELRRG